MASECQRTDCKQMALDKFYDAYALYKADRYLSSMYLCGYVIEIGIKHKFWELGETALSNNLPKSIVTYMFDSVNAIPDDTPKVNEAKRIIGNTIFPTNIRELCEYTQVVADIALQLGVKEDGKQQEKSKSLSTHLKNSPITHVMIKTAYPKTSEGSFHDLEKFLEALIEWYKKLEFASEKSQLTQFRTKHESNIKDWNTHLRYQEPNVASDSVKSREMMVSCHDFLLEILKFRPAEIRDYQKIVKLLAIQSGDNNLQNLD